VKPIETIIFGTSLRNYRMQNANKRKDLLQVAKKLLAADRLGCLIRQQSWRHSDPLQNASF
jgi:hypothetical protein